MALTATRMSRPFASGFAASKSIRASACSIPSDFLYPTAFIWRSPLLYGDAGAIGPIQASSRRKLQAEAVPCDGKRPIQAISMPLSLLIARLGAYICFLYPLRIRLMISVRISTLFVVLLATGPALAQDRIQDRRVPSSQAELRLSYAPIVQRVQPAVVNVYAAKVVQNHNPLLDDPIFRRFFGVPGQQPEQMQRSLGSGVMVDASGLVVTNNHVIEGADQVKVSLSDKREFEAEIVLKDSRSDLA